MTKKEQEIARLNGELESLRLQRENSELRFKELEAELKNLQQRTDSSSLDASLKTVR